MTAWNNNKHNGLTWNLTPTERSDLIQVIASALLEADNRRNDPTRRLPSTWSSIPKGKPVDDDDALEGVLKHVGWMEDGFLELDPPQAMLNKLNKSLNKLGFNLIEYTQADHEETAAEIRGRMDKWRAKDRANKEGNLKEDRTSCSIWEVPLWNDSAKKAAVRAANTSPLETMDDGTLKIFTELFEIEVKPRK